MSANSTSQRKPLLKRLCLGLWVAVVAAWSLLRYPPGAQMTAAFEGADKVGHAVAYAVLSLLIVWNAARKGWPARLIWSAAGGATLGVVLECAQPLTGRTFDVGDLGANAVGIAVALLGYAAAAELSSRTPPRQ